MNHYPLAERKLVYCVLHQHLTEHPELMDCTLLDDLQTGLQKIAQSEGVDVTDHGAWDEWLGNEPTNCAVRVANRKLIQ
jgi:hypothetical protein